MYTQIYIYLCFNCSISFILVIWGECSAPSHSAWVLSVAKTTGQRPGLSGAPGSSGRRLRLWPGRCLRGTSRGGGEGGGCLWVSLACY